LIQGPSFYVAPVRVIIVPVRARAQFFR
jgi:hypothetical protein